MKLLIKKSVFAFLIITISLTSCFNDNESVFSDSQEHNPTAFAENFGNEISRDFLGTIIDKNNNPIENVTVTIGNSSTQTDANGVFIINNATVRERFGYVKAEKIGYLHGSRSIVPSTGTNKVTIMLLEETVVGTTNSGTSATITSPEGASVTLAGNYVKADGSVYSGSVNVIMHHLDPADEDMQYQMPGMLYAANAQNEERMLQTFGMLAVELKGSGGEKLNIAEGSSAQIKVPLDASLLANAPSSIPLWHFDETHGYWIEDGQATLVGNAYIGTVTHFSFWNCDIPAQAITLCVTASDEAGNLLDNINITITSTTYGSRGGYTNANGEVCGLVPRNETLTLTAYNLNDCGNVALYTSTIGPFSTDSSISITIADNVDIISETVTGNFNSCNGNPVTDGYVLLKYLNQTYINTVSDGSFEINLLRCSDENTFKIKASDYVNLQTTDSISYTFTTPLTNIGMITSCNTVTEFINYQIDNEEPVIILEGLYGYFYPTNPNSNFPGLNINGYSNDQTNGLYMQGHLNPAPYVGTYGYSGFGIESIGFAIEMNISEVNNNIVFNLNELGAVGEYIDINFSGDYEDYQGNPHTINGVVHILRDQ